MSRDLSLRSDWLRGSYCAEANCAEVRQVDDAVEFRNSTSPGVVVRMTLAEWDVLVRSIRAGELSVDLGS